MAGSALLLALLALEPAIAAAQVAEDSTAMDSAATASVEATLGVTVIQRRAFPVAAAAGLVDVGLPVRIGGGGRIVLGHPTARATSRDAAYDLRVGYGGMLAAARLAAHGKTSLEARALFGVGNAKVLLPTGAILIGADNFGVVEPEIVGTIHFTDHLTVLADASFRFAFGVEDLPGVGPSDLSGASLRVGLSMGSR